MHFVAADPEIDGGCRVDFGGVPIPVGDSDPLDPARFERRDGFSPVNTILWKPGAAIDPSSLPPLLDPAASMSEDSAVQLWDLDEGHRIPCFAEVDAWPDQEEDERVLLIRPLESMGFETHVGVVITRNLLDPSGAAIPAPSDFAALRDGGAAQDSPEPVRKHYRALLARLEELEVDRSSLVLAWDFRTGSQANIQAPLDRVVDAMRQELPLDRDFVPEHTISSILDVDEGGAVAPGNWREVRGSLRLTHWLWASSGAEDASEDEHDRGWFELDGEGLPLPRAVDDAYFTLVVPASVHDAAPGTVPVIVFGHGLFSAPQNYLASSTDANGTVDLCSRLGAICVGTEWRGLTERDVADAVRVATNLGRFPLLTDKLIQGVSNQLAVARAFRTGLVDSPWLQAADGQGSLVDPDRIHYFGISLGGIEGATFLATTEVVEHGVLHVPGAAWATMLERSSNWTDFESFVVEVQPDPPARQQIFAMSQLLWDPVDPMSYTEALASRSVLWQLSIGDEQVPNFTAETLARTLGVPLVGEPVVSVFGLEELAAPSGPGASGVSQFHSGYAEPPPGNRPAPVTGAHQAIRHTDAMKEQVEAFFEPGAEGTIVHPCAGPCQFSPDADD